jgi:hypothetical protein
MDEYEDFSFDPANFPVSGMQVRVLLSSMAHFVLVMKSARANSLVMVVSVLLSLQSLSDHH